jgi:hypothetical protein
MRFVNEIFAISVTQCVVAIIILFPIRKIHFGKHRGKSVRLVRTIGWKGRSGHISIYIVNIVNRLFTRTIYIYYEKDLKTECAYFPQAHPDLTPAMRETIGAYS